MVEQPNIPIGKDNHTKQLIHQSLTDFNDFDRKIMQRCLELARRALGYTSPNPMVGAVIIKDGEIIGEGFHPKAGEPHAEVFALKNAGENARGATVYVNPLLSL